MKKRGIILFVTAVLVGASCTGRHFITDEDCRAQIEQDFEAKKALLPHGDLFTVFDKPGLTQEEREALQFLYAYMPVADIMNRDGDFYLQQVRSSLQTKREMEWGKRIPEMIFRHFVLPVRVNNEDLDSARIVFASELKERIKGMSMHDAVLEINHWCHEHVVYTPTDMRTIAPLAIVKTAWGRCGEESTFTVTALRSVGIPARQIYTPRWAHTDSNHAWVEAWVDGKWFFFGACEPEPVLNLGWFNGPAYRALLLHTRVFGKYGGPEEVMMQTANFTEINVLSDYAPTALGTVTVTDANGKPVKDASVEFMIYNALNFSSVLTGKSDENGQCRLTAGQGDMFIWVSKGDRVGCGKLSFGKDENITIVLDRTPSQLTGFDLDIVPPAPGTVPTAEAVTDEMRRENSRRLAEEDSIRGDYLATFLTPEDARAEARYLNIDDWRVAGLLETSRGNWQEIMQFLEETPPEQREKAVELLGIISRKDLQDTPISVLRAHFEETINNGTPLFVSYVLNPRIGSELLTPYRKLLRDMFTPEFAEQAQKNPELLVDWCKKELTLIDELNPQRIMATPVSVARARVCDAESRNVFFIALCRSFGIPARTEAVTRKIQYHSDTWHNVDFDGTAEINLPQGNVTISFDHPTELIPDPVYRQHFTISRIGEDGKLQARNYRGYLSTLMKSPLRMDVGTYMLLSGTRMADGSVLARVEFFTVEEDRTAKTQIVMRDSRDEIQVIGSMNPETLYQPVDGNAPKSFLSETGRGYFVIGILGSRQEPTNHAMNDIARVAAGFNSWGRSMILLFPDEQGFAQFDADEFKGLPATITYGIDIGRMADKLAGELHLPNATTLPIFIIADSFGRIVYVSQGYTIGIGDEMLKVISKLK